ncbi:MAG: hypothetical protein AMXMBFR82_32890 [Candidatus Hydrogenedentota bacterium]
MSSISPQVRRRARERAVQFLFGLDFTSYDWREVIADFWRVNPSRPGVRDYAEKLIAGVIDQRADLDNAIAATLETWSPGRIGRVERNVLRVAAWEMLYAGDVPRNVAINEAIEVAKRFGTDDAPRFINGILDKIQVPGE